MTADEQVRWSAEEAQEMDRWLLSRGFTIEQLMAVAGRRVAEAAHALMAERGLRRVVMLVGPGNNGGDAVVAAGHLREEVPVRIWRPLQGDPVPELDAETLVVDGLFGVGLARPIEGEARRAVEAVNASDAVVLAVDVPSGLSCDSGEVIGDVAVGADATVTFVGPKQGFFAGRGPELVGAWKAVDIGFPVEEAEAWVRERRRA